MAGTAHGIGQDIFVDDRIVSQQNVLPQESLVRSDTVPSAGRMHTARSFPELLLKLREERDFSKAELAKRANLDPSSITRFEQGQRAPERATILQIAEAMALPGIDRDRLLASAGFRSDVWDDPTMVDLVLLLNDDTIEKQARAEVRSVLKMASAFLRLQRLKPHE